MGWLDACLDFGNNENTQNLLNEWRYVGSFASLFFVCECIVHSHNRIHLGCFINGIPFLISVKRIVEQDTHTHIYTFTVLLCTQKLNIFCRRNFTLDKYQKLGINARSYNSEQIVVCMEWLEARATELFFFLPLYKRVSLLYRCNHQM